MNRTVVLNVAGLSNRCIGESTPCLTRFAAGGSVSTITPAFPAVTCTAQATYLTGLAPSQHGIVGNGWYDRTLAEVHFWKQSNHLVRGKKLWDVARETTPGFTCANLFWWFNRYSSVDYSITPRPIYCADGKKIFDITSAPPGITPDIKRDLDEFPFHAFWGPRAGIASSRWISEAAQWMENRYHPSLQLVYLPHLDYDLQRLTPDPTQPKIQVELRKIDEVVGGLITFFESRGIQVIILSEYGITPVDRPVHLNRIFRQHGWLAIKEEIGREILDCGASRAFAVADHQIAHVYVNDQHDETLLNKVRGVLENTEGVETVFDRTQQENRQLWHPRSGDFLVTAVPKAWFSYYYWDDDDRAPDFARTVDIHRKPGYDPTELFLDPTLRFPMGRVATFLLKKKLGFRALLELTPLDTTLVKGSHGRVPEDANDHPVLMVRKDERPLPQTLAAQDVFTTLLSRIR